MLEELIVLSADMHFCYFFEVTVDVLVQVGLAEGGKGTAEIVPHLLHHLLVEDVLGPSEGKRRPSVVSLPLLVNEV